MCLSYWHIGAFVGLIVPGSNASDKMAVLRSRHRCQNPSDSNPVFKSEAVRTSESLNGRQSDTSGTTTIRQGAGTAPPVSRNALSMAG